MVAALLVAPTTAADSDKESAVRAAFLYRLAFFVTWPEQRFADARAPIRFCMEQAVSEQLRTQLDAAARRRQVNQRPLQVQAWSGDGEACDLLYLSGGGPSTLSVNSGTLVVVDSSEALERIGQLALVKESGAGGESRLVFHGNRERIAQSDYTLSSKLLSLVRFSGD